MLKGKTHLEKESVFTHVPVLSNLFYVLIAQGQEFFFMYTKLGTDIIGYCKLLYALYKLNIKAMNNSRTVKLLSQFFIYETYINAALCSVTAAYRLRKITIFSALLTRSAPSPSAHSSTPSQPHSYTLAYARRI